MIKAFRTIFLLTLGMVWLAPAQTAQAQNLITNGGFEADSLDDIITNFREDTLPGSRICEGWYQPTKADPDFYNSDESRLRAFALIKAHTGKGRIALYLAQREFGDSVENYREYIGTRLNAPLKASTEYCLTFYVAFDQRNKYCTKSIGACFTKDSLLGNDESVINAEPQFVITDTRGIAPEGKWMKLTFTYKAKGGERFLTIGNFDKSFAVKLKTFHHKKRYKKTWCTEFNRYAYYYIDDVAVIPITNCHDSQEVAKTINYYKGSLPLIALQPLKFVGIGLGAFAIIQIVRSDSK